MVKIACVARHAVEHFERAAEYPPTYTPRYKRRVDKVEVKGAWIEATAGGCLSREGHGGRPQAAGWINLVWADWPIQRILSSTSTARALICGGKRTKPRASLYSWPAVRHHRT